jgi:hypothetical protein
MIDPDGYSDEWHTIEAAWCAEPAPECDIVRRAKELQAKQPASKKPTIRMNGCERNPPDLSVG